jgi:hypothetical protein
MMGLRSMGIAVLVIILVAVALILLANRFLTSGQRRTSRKRQGEEDGR